MQKGTSRLVILHLRVHELEFNLSHKDCDHNLSDVFCQGFANAHSSSTEEGSEGHRVTFLARWSQEEFVIAGVKPFRNVLIWLYPLVRIMMEIGYIDSYLLVLQDFLPCKLDRVRDLVKRGNSDAWVYSQSLIDAVSKVVTFGQEIRISVLCVQKQS